MYIVCSQGLYKWLVIDNEQFDLLEACPEIVLGKYVAITSIDSGVLVPNDNERASGWETRNQIAYSPKVQTIESLPREGWDEWYIFNKPTDLGASNLAANIFEAQGGPRHLSVFVNYGFTFHRPGNDSLAGLFWQQMEWIRPESYIGDNNFLNFATANKAFFDKVHQAAKALV